MVAGGEKENKTVDDIRAFLQDKINSGIGIREISRKTGVAPSVISRICNGKENANIGTINCILFPFGFKLAISRLGQIPIIGEKDGK